MPIITKLTKELFMLQPIIFKENKLILLDQRKLPLEELYIECTSLNDAINAIKDMVVRGAPCIGYTAIFGLALWLKDERIFDSNRWSKACDQMRSARPTAVNLMFETQKCFNLINENASALDIKNLYLKLVELGFDELKKSEIKNTKMAHYGINYLKELYGSNKIKLMTHCNTGRLACGSLGTALGVISEAAKLNMIEMVWVDETRPYLQGSRLTSFELLKEKIPHKIVVEGAASYLMNMNLVDAIFVGADRIAANGDTANKIGTSTLAIVAKNYNVPFFVVAPLSSFDFKTPSGREIEIELRDENEILSYKNQRFAPESVSAYNPSFDVTDHSHITGIICENGLVLNPNVENLKRLQ
jgi:methylthioribose-1-phosphate isomerase